MSLMDLIVERIKELEIEKKKKLKLQGDEAAPEEQIQRLNNMIKHNIDLLERDFGVKYAELVQS